MMKKGLNLKFNIVPPPNTIEEEQKEKQEEDAIRANTTIEILNEPLLEKANNNEWFEYIKSI